MPWLREYFAGGQTIKGFLDAHDVPTDRLVLFGLIGTYHGQAQREYDERRAKRQRDDMKT